MQDSEPARLADNIVLFARTLRKAGLTVGTGQLLDALHGVALAGIESRADLYWGLRALLVKRRAQARLFDQAFHMYFRNPRLLERMMAMLLPTLEQEAGPRRTEAAARRMLEALASATHRESEDLETLEEARIECL